MALADLMKKGYLTSATATPATVATHGIKNQPTVATIAFVAVADFENSKLASKTGMMALPEQACDFMEEDGMALAPTKAMAAISVQTRPPVEWLLIIAAFDVMVERYCSSSGLSVVVRSAILSAKCGQSLASIPETLAWFQREVASVAMPIPPAAALKRNSGCRPVRR